jgi:hypothetical protein
MRRVRGRGGWRLRRMLMDIGLDGALGFVVSRKFQEAVFVDGWIFGGVRLEPVFETAR